jgi:tetratricopeptide (TPR) repeat protein
MKVRGDPLFPGRIFSGRVAQRVQDFGLAGCSRVLEIEVDGVPVQLEPPRAVQIIEATLEEWASLQEAGYELHGTPPAAAAEGADALYDRGCACLAQGALDEAAAFFTQALAVNPADAQAHFNRGYVFAAQVQQLACIAVERPDGSRQTWRDPRARLLLDRAVADFTQALLLDPGMAKAYGMRAQMYCLLGANDLALADYRQAARLGDPVAAQLLRERFGCDE